MANMLALKPNATSITSNTAGTQEQEQQQQQEEELVLYEVQEVWSGGKVLAGVGPIKCSKTSCEPPTVDVLPHGGTTYVRLVPTKQQNATRSSTRSTAN